MSSVIDRSPEAMATRRSDVVGTLGTLALSGMHLDQAGLALLERYVVGEIDVEEYSSLVDQQLFAAA